MKTWPSIFICYTLFALSNSFGQQQVYLESHEIGRGILKARMGECFVITPSHVVQKETRPFQVRGVRNVLSKGELLESYEPDLAVVRIIDGGKQNCEDWDIDPDYDKILLEADDGVLEVLQPNGSSKALKVFLSEKDDTYITIRPYFADDKIIKGMSGSSLFTKVNGKRVFLGMLMQVDTENKGIVLRTSSIDKVLNSFFSKKPTKLEKPATPSIQSLTESGYKFEFVECKRSGSNIICKLLITSELKDSQLIIFADYYQYTARLSDQDGLEYHPENVRLGNQINGYSVGGDYTLVKGIKTPLEFKFKDISDGVKGIPLFRFFIDIPGQGKIEIKFRNILLAGSSNNFHNPFQKGIQSREINGIDFQLLECIHNGTSVICRLLVKSNLKDQNLKIIANYYQFTAQLYDQEGIAYYPKHVKLGNQLSTGAAGDNYTLVHNIQTLVEFTFENVLESTKGIGLFRFFTEIPGLERTELKFYTISFSGSKSNFTPPTIKGVQSRIIDGIDFQLIKCKRNGTDLVLHLLVKSLQKDRFVNIIANYYQFTAKVRDINGIEYQPSSARLGNQIQNGSVGDNYLLVKDIQTELEFTFKDFPESGNTVTLLKFFFSVMDLPRSAVEFVKIPIT